VAPGWAGPEEPPGSTGAGPVPAAAQQQQQLPAHAPRQPLPQLQPQHDPPAPRPPQPTIAQLARQQMGLARGPQGAPPPGPAPLQLSLPEAFATLEVAQPAAPGTAASRGSQASCLRGLRGPQQGRCSGRAARLAAAGAILAAKAAQALERQQPARAKLRTLQQQLWHKQALRVRLLASAMQPGTPGRPLQRSAFGSGALGPCGPASRGGSVPSSPAASQRLQMGSGSVASPTSKAYFGSPVKGRLMGGSRQLAADALLLQQMRDRLLLKYALQVGVDWASGQCGGPGEGGGGELARMCPQGKHPGALRRWATSAPPPAAAGVARLGRLVARRHAAGGAGGGGRRPLPGVGLP
jgi:hypothetical protein